MGGWLRWKTSSLGPLDGCKARSTSQAREVCSRDSCSRVPVTANSFPFLTLRTSMMRALRRSLALAPLPATSKSPVTATSALTAAANSATVAWVSRTYLLTPASRRACSRCSLRITSRPSEAKVSNRVSEMLSPIQSIFLDLLKLKNGNISVVSGCALAAQAAASSSARGRDDFHVSTAGSISERAAANESGGAEAPPDARICWLQSS